MTERTTATPERAADASWAVEHFRKFWSAPDPTGPTPHLSPEIVGRWPDGRVLEGIDEYRERLINIGRVIPDIRLEVVEHAVNGELAFIRWQARGTGQNGPLEIIGIDRLRVRGDQITENAICFDTATFEAQVGVPLSST